MKPSLHPATDCFPEHERERVTATAKRYMIAQEDCDQLVFDHMKTHVDPVRLARFGPPDTSTNPLVQIGLSVSTPGHYGQHPALVGDASGKLSAAMAPLWPRAQYREFLAYCLGSCAQHVATGADGALIYRIVPPCDLWADADPDDPTRPVVMRWLRVREVGGEPAYTWDVWDISGSAPRFAIHVAERGGQMGLDITATVAPHLAGTYPWVTSTGRAFIPWSIDRSRDDGSMWNWRIGRGAAVGSLNTMMLGTATNRTALNATGGIVILVDATLSTASTTMSPSASQSIEVNPGDIVHAKRDHPDVQPMVSEIGEVDTLDSLSAYTDRYATRVVTSMGISPSDAVRVGANPMSGVAIHLTNQGKRDEQYRRNPLCQVCDLATIGHVAVLLGLDADGVGIVYHEIPKSPDEDRAEREGQEWAVDQGYKSKIDVMIERNPGMTRDQAIAELRRIRADEEAIAAPARPVAAPVQEVQSSEDSPDNEDDNMQEVTDG